MAGRRVMTGALVLDSEGLSILADGDKRTRAYFETARVRRARVVVSAVTLTDAGTLVTCRYIECCPGSWVVVTSVTPDLGRIAANCLAPRACPVTGARSLPWSRPPHFSRPVRWCYSPVTVTI